MGNYHARCGAGEKPEVETPEAYLSLFLSKEHLNRNDLELMIERISVFVYAAAKRQPPRPFSLFHNALVFVHGVAFCPDGVGILNDSVTNGISLCGVI